MHICNIRKVIPLWHTLFFVTTTVNLYINNLNGQGGSIIFNLAEDLQVLPQFLIPVVSFVKLQYGDERHARTDRYSSDRFLK
jgi:hypothetical protein